MKKIALLLFLLIISCGKDDIETSNITWEVNGQGLSTRIQGGGYGNEYQVFLPWTSSFKTAETDNLGLFVRLNDSTLANDGLESIILKIDGEVIVEKTNWIHSASVTPGMILPDDTGLWSYIDGVEGKSYSALPPTSYASE
ncbi:hypothetical protein [uncultured Muriicola sp.]|uniref:hypothetical protein n=1 Tax=uncultured Muriicola sp. TaxID=1583102 RepID=UPI002627211F|nr:hypothetical protein [uncultured Muriicola sp.]